MTNEVFSIFDSATKAFMAPFCVPTKGSAIRAFTDAVNDAQTPFNKHPADYSLFKLGLFDDSNGSFVLNLAPERIVLATEVLNARVTPSDALNTLHVLNGEK